MTRPAGLWSAWDVAGWLGCCADTARRRLRALGQAGTLEPCGKDPVTGATVWRRDEVLAAGIRPVCGGRSGGRGRSHPGE